MKKLVLKVFFVFAVSSMMAMSAQAKVNYESLRTQAWKSWCKAYMETDTFRLPALDSLKDSPRFAWQIPAELEPHATMPFFYGCKGDKPTAGYPLFVYMHGSGPKDYEWVTGQKLAMIFKADPSVYAIPQIPNEGDYYRWWQKGKQWAWNRLLRLAFISGNIDPARVYFFGISEGGYGSQRLASFYADYLAAAGPMAGGEPLRNAPAENLGNIFFSLRSGENDVMFYRNMMTAYVGEVLDSLAVYYPGEYKHYVNLEAGRGHGIDYRPTPIWLSNYSRNAQPKRFRWENFEMDGIKRNAFYNLEVLQEDTAATRTFYDFSVEKNIINLNVSSVEYEVTFQDSIWNIPFLFERHLTPAKQGKVRIYLSESLVNFDAPILVKVNGKAMFSGKIKTSKKQVRNTMRQSLELFGDPLRIFPAAIEVEVKD